MNLHNNLNLDNANEITIDNITDTPVETSEVSNVSYRNHPGISQSELKKLSYDPLAYFSKEKVNYQKAHFTLGTLVDVLITDPNSFNDKFKIIPDGAKPTGNLLKLTEYLIGNAMQITDDNLLLAQKETKYQPTWGINAVTKWFYLEAFNYYTESLNNPTKLIVEQEQFERALSVVDSLQNNPYTKVYCSPNENPNIERVYQLEIYFNKRVDNKIDNDQQDILCKGCLDIVDIDHVNKTIQPFDVKTTGKSTREFPSSMRNYRYDMQGASYSFGLIELTKGRGESIPAIDVSNYKVLPFKFIVETTDASLIGSPMIYEMSECDLLCGMYGVNYNNKAVPAYSAEGLLMPIPNVPGWATLLEQLLWHETSGIYNYTPKEYYQLNGNGAIKSYIW